MNIVLNVNKKTFNSAYVPYIKDYTHKYEVYYGGSGSGKSVFIGQKLIVKALESKRKILVIRKTAVSQKESCWRLIIELLSKWNIYNYCSINKSDLTIELPNGSSFLFKGLDDPERIKSIVGITDCWCEECTELNEEDFEQLTLRVRDRVDNLQFFCSFNPISKANWVYKRWFSEESVISEDTLIVKTTYKDNRFLPDSYIKTLEAKISTNPTYYKIYALGEFCSLDKLVYNNWRIEEFDHHNIEGRLIIGGDFGFTNDPSTLVCSIIKDDKIYIFKEWGSTNKTNKEIANIIKDMGLSKSQIVFDSAEPKSIEELRREGIGRVQPARKGPDSIRAGIQKLQEYEFIVHPLCEGVITELENYSWKKDKQTNEYTNEPIDNFNHYLDALRYSMDLITSDRTLRVVNRNSLGL